MATFRRSIAVVVGINTYEHGLPRLQAAVSDAAAIAACLKEQHGYTTQPLLDEAATLQGLRDCLGSWLLNGHDALEKVGPDDRVLFYFAGHGVELETDAGPVGYLLPHNAARDDPATYLPMLEVHNYLTRLPCRHLLVVLDCCFAGVFGRTITRDAAPVRRLHRRRYERFTGSLAWQVLTSAHNEPAADVFEARARVDQHSPFAHALLDALQNPESAAPTASMRVWMADGVMTVTELYVYLRDALEMSPAGRLTQTPGLWPLSKHDKGEYVFSVPGRDPDLLPEPDLKAENSPYLGPEPYDERHGELFFGRKNEVRELREVVEGAPVTVVCGASGVGKTSLVRGGLLPALDGPEAVWRLLPVVRPGSAPLAALAAAVATLTDLGGAPPDVTALRADQGALAALAETSSRRLLLFIDPLDELFTGTPDVEERAQFLALLVGAATRHRDKIRVLGALGECHRSALLSLLGEGADAVTWFELNPMHQDQLRAVIETPAAVQAIYFEDAALVDTLINDAASGVGSLALLSIVLQSMYERLVDEDREDRTLTAKDYGDVGAVEGTLLRQMRRVRDALRPPEEATMRRVLHRITAHGEGPTRWTPLAELDYLDVDENDRARAVLARLRDARVLVESARVVKGAWRSATPGVELALPYPGELIGEANRSFVQGEGPFQALERPLRAAVLDWDESQRPTDQLWLGGPGSRLATVQRLLREEPFALNRVETQFILASLKYDGEETSRRLAARSQMLIERKPDLALLLAHEACRVDDTHDARNALLTGLQRHAHLLAYMRSPARGGRLGGMAFGARGAALVVTCGARAHLGNVHDRAMTSPPLAHAEATMNSVAFSPDGRTVAVDGFNRSVVLLNAATGDLLARLGEEPQGAGGRIDLPFDPSFSPDGSVLAALSFTDVRLWDLASLLPKARLQAGPNESDAFMVAAFSPDGRSMVFGTGGGALVLWQIERDEILWRVPRAHDGEIFGVAFNPDGRTLASGGKDGIVRVWHAATGEPVDGPPTDHGEQVELIAFTRDGKRLTSVSQVRVIVWSADERRRLGEPIMLPTPKVDLRRWAISPDGTTLATAMLIGEGDRSTIEVCLWSLDVAPPMGVPLSGHRYIVTGVAFNRDGSTLASCGHDPPIVMWDVATRTASDPPRTVHPQPLASIAFHPDGTLLASGGLASKDRRGEVRLWSIATREASGPPMGSHQGSVDAVAFSPDGRWLATLTQATSALRLWEVATRSEVAIPLLEGTSCWGLAFHPESTLLAVGEDSTGVLLWDLTTRQTLDVYPPALGGRVRSLTFSPDGRALALGLSSGELFLWDREAPGKVEAFFPGHVGEIGHVVFSPDGRTLASDDSVYYTIALWDVSTRRPLGLPLADHRSTVLGLAFSPDGGLLASCSEDGRVILWDISPELWRTRALRLANRELTPAERREYLGEPPDA